MPLSSPFPSASLILQQAKTSAIYRECSKEALAQLLLGNRSSECYIPGKGDSRGAVNEIVLERYLLSIEMREESDPFYSDTRY